MSEKKESIQSRRIKNNINIEYKRLKETEELREWVEGFRLNEYFDEENETSIIIELGFEKFKNWAFKKIMEKKQ